MSTSGLEFRPSERRKAESLSCAAINISPIRGETEGTPRAQWLGFSPGTRGCRWWGNLVRKSVMSRFKNSLDHVRVAAPCKADWEQMIGTDRVRFCGQCNLNVYNLSSMTKNRAESLIAQTEGRLCVRFYRRTDGSILTENCPVGLRAIRRRLSYLAKAVSAAVLSFFAGLGVYESVAPSPLNTPRMGVMVETVGDVAMIEQNPGLGRAAVTGKFSPPPLPNPDERTARRRRGKLRTEPTRQNRSDDLN